MDREGSDHQPAEKDGIRDDGNNWAQDERLREGARLLKPKGEILKAKKTKQALRVNKSTPQS